MTLLPRNTTTVPHRAPLVSIINSIQGGGNIPREGKFSIYRRYSEELLRRVMNHENRNGGRGRRRRERKVRGAGRGGERLEFSKGTSSRALGEFPRDTETYLSQFLRRTNKTAIRLFLSLFFPPRHYQAADGEYSTEDKDKGWL